MTNTHPICGYSCALNALYHTGCNYNGVCICKSSSYAIAFYNCIDSSCSDADIQAWIQYATANCAALGETWPSKPPPVATGTKPVIATTDVAVIPTAFRTFTVVAGSTIPVIESILSTATIGPFGVLPTDTGSTTPTAPAISQALQYPDNGLSTGAKIGIAIGAVAIALLFVAIGLLIFYLKRNKKRANQNQALQPGTTTTPNISEFDAKDAPYSGEKEHHKAPFGTKTVISTTGALRYNEKSVSVPELAHDPRRDTSASGDHRMSPSPSPSAPLSPLSAFSELTAVVPSEMDSHATAQTQTQMQTHRSPVSPHQSPAAVYDVHELSSTQYWLPSGAQELAAPPPGPRRGMPDENARGS